jgi:amidohydrolase
MTATAPAGLVSRDLLTPVTALYLDLHRHPELSGSEQRTARRLAQWLRADGFEVGTGVGGHGVVGVLHNGPGPTVMVRAELDALPVEERTELPYASTAVVPGPDGPTPVMHACGHDLHLAAAAGAARLLARTAPQWRGTLMVVGQPAEETLSGARAMLADGVYERFGRPSVILAQHLAPMPGGMVAHGHGPMLAGSLTLRVVVHGRGGHAATPHLTVDPVVAAAAIVLRLQTIVSRETSPAEQVVVTVGRLRAGAAGNVVAEQAELEVTVRALSDATVRRVEEAVRRIVAAEAVASGCVVPPDVVELSRSEVVVPDPDVAATVAAAHREHLGAARVADWPASLATEDVSRFCTPDRGPRIPLAYWMLGSAGRREWAAARPGGSTEERLAALAPNHSPRFAPAPGLALSTGMAALVSAATSQLDRT